MRAMAAPRPSTSSSSTLPPPMPPLPAASSTHHYIPLPPLSLRSPPPAYRLPTLLTTYSHLPDRSTQPGDASMAYRRACPVGADLNYGYERRVERAEDEEEHLDGLCEALRRVKEEGGAGERKGGIITWRGMITRIMQAPYEPHEPWEMTAIPLAGSVYVELYDPPEIRAARNLKQKAWERASYMGYAFESFSTVSPPRSEGFVEQNGRTDGDDPGRGNVPEGWGGDVNTNVQWCNVVRSAIGDIPLCLGGEVDCVDAPVGSPHPGLSACVELKTNKVIEHEKHDQIFHKKLLKHWAQSFLLGIPTVEVGFRDDAGIIRSLRSFQTLSIPRMISSLPQPPWHPSPAFHFLHTVLSSVLHHVLPTDPTPSGGLPAEHDPLPPATVWHFSFVPRRGCELWCVGRIGLDERTVRWGGVLPVDYVRWRMQDAAMSGS